MMGTCTFVAIEASTVKFVAKSEMERYARCVSFNTRLIKQVATNANDKAAIPAST